MRYRNSDNLAIMQSSIPKNRIVQHCIVALTLVIFIGCSAIRSSRHGGETTGTGLAYYLPKGLLKISIIEDIAPEAGSTPLANQAATNSPGAKAQTDAPTNFSTTGTNATTASPAAAPSVMKTNVSVTVDVELVPDRVQRFLLRATPSVMSDDYVKLRVSNGLLETVTITNTDQTVGIVSNLALAAIEFYRSATFMAAGGAERRTNIYFIDPFTERGSFAATAKRQFGVDLDFTDFTSTLPTPNATDASGVFYKPLEAYRFAWRSPAGNGAGIVFLPNSSPILSLQVRRATGVSQASIFSFQQGIPIETTLNKPSQALALSSLPLTIARSVVTLPTNLLQMKIDYTSRSTDLIQAQQAQITNLNRLLELKAASNGPAPTSEQTRGGNTNTP